MGKVVGATGAGVRYRKYTPLTKTEHEELLRYVKALETEVSVLEMQIESQLTLREQQAEEMARLRDDCRT